MTSRDVRLIREPVPTLEGAGVHLRRAFGQGDEALFDPFLMLDDFRGDRPADYEAGFPWHPHRGIETITYMLEGECDHGDSMGNSGTICAGDVQWMTAGGGIVHQEMPRAGESGRMGGFQLWANLPAAQKMRDPRYQGVESAQIPQVEADGARVRVIAGKVAETVGPVRDVTVEPEYLDVTLGADATWTRPTMLGHTAFAYLFEGDGRFGASEKVAAARLGVLVLFDDGDEVTVTAGPEGARLILVSGKPLHEPVAWRGPIVMSTREELEQAWRDLDAGTFVKRG
jgi:redox-sensitive bicupin YhaK (pirin superfamily)